MYQKCSPLKQMKCSQKVAQTNGEENYYLRISKVLMF